MIALFSRARPVRCLASGAALINVRTLDIHRRVRRIQQCQGAAAARKLMQLRRRPWTQRRKIKARRRGRKNNAWLVPVAPGCGSEHFSTESLNTLDVPSRHPVNKNQSACVSGKHFTGRSLSGAATASRNLTSVLCIFTSQRRQIAAQFPARLTAASPHFELFMTCPLFATALPQPWLRAFKAWQDVMTSTSIGGKARGVACPQPACDSGVVRCGDHNFAASLSGGTRQATPS